MLLDRKCSASGDLYPTMLSKDSLSKICGQPRKTAPIRAPSLRRLVSDA